MTPSDWSQMIEQLEDALNRTSSELTRHEQTLASPLLSDDLAHEHHTSWQRALERFEERVEEFRSRVEQADEQAQVAEVSLAQHEESVRGICERLEAIREKLADAATRF